MKNSWRVNPTILEKNYSKKVPKEYHSVIDIFMKCNADMLLEHREEDYIIQLKEGKSPLFVQNYMPLLDQENDAMIKYIQEYLRKSFIQPSSSTTAVSVLLVKKSGGEVHFYVDYHALNAVIIKNWYPISLINKILKKLAHAVSFTKLNIIAMFNRMRIKEGQEWITAFNIRHSQFEYLVMPFDLCNAPRTFQNYINNSLHEYLDVFCTVYLDDVLVYSTKKEEHTGHVLDVLKRLWDQGLQVDVNKCEFSVTWMKYFNLIISTDGINIDPKKIQCILD